MIQETKWLEMELSKKTIHWKKNNGGVESRDEILASISTKGTLVLTPNQGTPTSKYVKLLVNHIC